MYKPTIWQDHVEGVQEGTDMNAKNFNNIETGVMEAAALAAMNAENSRYQADARKEIVDCIVEEGKKANWSYVKYASGIAKCWATIHLKYASTIKSVYNASANLTTYYFGTVINDAIIFPDGLFAEVPQVFCVASGSGHPNVQLSAPSKTGTGVAINTVFEMSEGSDIWIQTMAIGRWK